MFGDDLFGDPNTLEFRPGESFAFVGTRGTLQFTIDRLIAEGGFGGVYAVRDARARQYALKKIKYKSKVLRDRSIDEARLMMSIPDCENIVKCYDYQVNSYKDENCGEVIVLMELVSGGNVVELMNKRRLQRFTDIEIFNIFIDILKAVCHLHAQNPPIIHRDLKVENVLLDMTGKYKLCDFGSATRSVYQCTTREQAQVVSMDIERFTTVFYRAPEMIDLTRGLVIDEKADVWALGVLLYKLAYYTTPFEETGIAGILSARYGFPPVPPTLNTASINFVVQSILITDPSKRPDVFALAEKTCQMINRPCPVRRPQHYGKVKPEVNEDIAELKRAIEALTGVTIEGNPGGSGKPTPTIAAKPAIAGSSSQSDLKQAGSSAPQSSSSSKSPTPQTESADPIDAFDPLANIGSKKNAKTPVVAAKQLGPSNPAAEGTLVSLHDDDNSAFAAATAGAAAAPKALPETPKKPAQQPAQAEEQEQERERASKERERELIKRLDREREREAEKEKEREREREWERERERERERDREREREREREKEREREAAAAAAANNAGKEGREGKDGKDKGALHHLQNMAQGAFGAISSLFSSNKHQHHEDKGAAAEGSSTYGTSGTSGGDDSRRGSTAERPEQREGGSSRGGSFFKKHFHLSSHHKSNAAGESQDGTAAAGTGGNAASEYVSLDSPTSASTTAAPAEQPTAAPAAAATQRPGKTSPVSAPGPAPAPGRPAVAQQQQQPQQQAPAELDAFSAMLGGNPAPARTAALDDFAAMLAEPAKPPAPAVTHSLVDFTAPAPAPAPVAASTPVAAASSTASSRPPQAQPQQQQQQQQPAAMPVAGRGSTAAASNSHADMLFDLKFDAGASASPAGASKQPSQDGRAGPTRTISQPESLHDALVRKNLDLSGNILGSTGSSGGGGGMSGASPKMPVNNNVPVSQLLAQNSGQQGPGRGSLSAFNNGNQFFPSGGAPGGAGAAAGGSSAFRTDSPTVDSNMRKIKTMGNVPQRSTELDIFLANGQQGQQGQQGNPGHRRSVSMNDTANDPNSLIQF